MCCQKVVSTMTQPAWAGSDILRAISKTVVHFDCEGVWKETAPGGPWALFQVSSSERRWYDPNPFVVSSLTFCFTLFANNLFLQEKPVKNTYTVEKWVVITKHQGTQWLVPGKPEKQGLERDEAEVQCNSFLICEMKSATKPQGLQKLR